MPNSVLEYDPQYQGLCLNSDYGELNVDVYKTDNQEGGDALIVEISTAKTLLYSCGQVSRDPEKECESIVKLFQDPNVYPTFAKGTSIPEADTTKSYLNKCRLWKSGYPFSLFVIEDQKDGSFVGRIVMEDCDPHPVTGSPMHSHAEVGIAISGEKQHQGFGTQAITAVTYAWVPYVADAKYEIQGKPLTHLWATAHPDNATSKIFSKAGYENKGTFDHPIYKKPRNEFVKEVENATEISNRSRLKFKI